MSHAKATKVCPKCNQEFPRTFDYFYRDNSQSRNMSGICKKCSNARKKKWKDNNPNLVKAQRQKTRADLRQRYNLSKEKYDELVSAQEGKCMICLKHYSECIREKLYVDHCHKTGTYRGLLCHFCNIGLGNMKDSLENLERAVSYLKAFENTQKEIPVHHD